MGKYNPKTAPEHVYPPPGLAARYSVREHPNNYPAYERQDLVDAVRAERARLATEVKRLRAVLDECGLPIRLGDHSGIDYEGIASEAHRRQKLCRAALESEG